MKLRKPKIRSMRPDGRIGDCEVVNDIHSRVLCLVLSCSIKENGDKTMSEDDFEISGFWFAVLHIMTVLGLTKPYLIIIDRLLDLLGRDKK